MTKQEKIQLLKWISDGDIQKAIDALLAFKRSENLDREALAIASRYNGLKKKERSGTLSFEALKRTENEITEHLIALIHHPETEVYPAGKSTEKEHRSGPVLRNYIIFAAIAAVILLSLAEAFHIIDIIPPKDPLYLTVFVKDKEGRVALELEGEINISIGHRSFNKTIGEDGRTNFSDIPRKYKGDSIEIGLDAKGWEIIGKKTFIFTGDAIIIKVKRDDSLGTIRGTVRSRDGQEFIEGAKVTVKDTFTYTNEKGYFEIILPEAMRVKNEMERYTLTVSKPGYETKTQSHTPNSTDADIRLDKAGYQ